MYACPQATTKRGKEALKLVPFIVGYDTLYGLLLEVGELVLCISRKEELYPLDGMRLKE